MELVLVHPGEKLSFMCITRSVLSASLVGQGYFNVANLSVLPTQLCGSKPEELALAVERYDILSGKVNGDTMNIWAADQKFVKAAIEAGKIKGHGATIEDSTENLDWLLNHRRPLSGANKFTYTSRK